MTPSREDRVLHCACASLAIAHAMACASSGGDVQPISDPSGRPSGPTVPVPSSLWQPPAGSTPATGSYAYLLNLRRCGSLSGWFAIDHVFYFQGHLTAFDLRFEERCSGFVAPMHGQVHWTENNT